MTVLLLAICMATVSGMAWVVLREIEDLSIANSDNIQWSLSQAEVEFLQFENAALNARVTPDRLQEVRRRFDIFYSRIGTFQSGTIYNALREDPEFDSIRSALRIFLDETVPLIDGDDAALLAALPDLAQRAAELNDEVRRMTLMGLANFAEVSDLRRKDVTDSLTLMAAVLGLLLAGLSLVLLSFHHLYRQSVRNALDAQRTGARMHTIVDTSLDAIVVCDTEGRILDINTAAERLFGYRRAEAVGAFAPGLYFGVERSDELAQGALAFLAEKRRPQPGERRIETEAQSRDGRSFPVEISMDRAEDDGENVYVAFIRDIHRRKEAEAMLTRARDEALAGERAKAEILAVMSHEMRTPLNGLMGTMQLMQDQDLTPDQTAMLERMLSSGHLLLGVVNDVLELAKYEAGKLTADHRPFEVAPLLDSVIETTAPLAHANGNTLGWSWVGSPRACAAGDARRLRQVILNLVGNAVKFTHDGHIDIEAEVLGAQDDIVEFRVIDTGVGIAEENLERIFNDFETLDSSYSRKAGGTGLGLGISRRLLNLMGGTIGVESELGEGTMFWVRLPLPEAQLAQPAVASDEAAGDGTLARALSVLLVEDNEINRFVAREMLEAEGHDVTEAFDGRAGVERAEARRFDVILMDISMPVMDGQDAARAIRAGTGASRDAPIVAVTAHALPEEVARFRDIGMQRCISKPIDRATLVRTLRDIAQVDPATASAPPANAPRRLLDEDQLDELQGTVGLEGASRLLDKFLMQADASLAQVSGETGDPQILARKAHEWAGSCATFGLSEMHGLLKRIETGTKAGATPQDALAELPELWAQSRAALLRWRERLPTE
ncbi:ATP-binding protein [Sulfitobacter sp. D35]|uniref:hybrid sensor histidine kinase/response regulator n=1 Tax=Sulfitobacter sp. D35 TaxID=3083252 RepID=UPI00296FD4D7|nr:ATP-binding protein [Sulfitobacter sp. D35]MDW4498533.1 ATP-binding protein [Sulfitobacter sp. D35]